MAENPYPIPRETRQTDVLSGDGGATYGPFGFKIFDTEDVEVITRAAGETAFSVASVTVAKVSGLALDKFTITFPAALPATTAFQVRGRRVHERAAGVTSGTRLSPDALEKELSKQATALEELRRDAPDIDPDIGDGKALIRLGGRLIEGPDADQIQHAQENAEFADQRAKSAELSSASAGVASGRNIVATFDELATVFSYDGAGSTRLVAPGDRLLVEDLNKFYRVVDAADLSFDLDYTGIGGVKLKSVSPEWITPLVFGAANDGVGDDLDAMTKADAVARLTGLPLYLRGAYRTTGTFTITAQAVFTNETTITKDLDDSPVIIFQGGVGGLAGKFRWHSGKLKVQQSAKPSIAQTNAHGFLMQDVITTAFGHLEAGSCAYSFKNDATTPHGLFWGNAIASFTARGCVQGYIDLPFPGSGGHTENYVAAAYLNGKEWNDPALLPKNDVPIRLNNAEGFVFGTLNVEWTRISAGSLPFFDLINGTTLLIDAFHFEGNEKTDASRSSIFRLVNVGTQTTNVSVRNMNINGVVQTAGTLSLLNAGISAKGKVKVDAFSGVFAANTFADFRLIDTNGNATVEVGAESGWENYFTSVRIGALPPDFQPNVWFGGVPYTQDYAITNPGASIDIGKAPYMRLTGTSSTALTTISADTLMGLNSERHRIVPIVNDAGGLQLGSGGNINKQSSDAAWPVTVATSRTMLFSMDILDAKADLIGRAN